ncbi:hypothetical protein J4526_01840 [Desulfurococcaceae archaeon MEX13E-LK6-19]|nr:hypothetical protein J4526_01840 [Desulfurococcaceae archaeon MEX13E-LK6-19]
MGYFYCRYLVAFAIEKIDVKILSDSLKGVMRRQNIVSHNGINAKHCFV